MTPLDTPPEVEAYEADRKGAIRYWTNRRCECPPHDQLRVRLDLADVALAARTRQAEEERAARVKAEEGATRAMAFILPGGYDEELAARVMTDPVLFAFAFVADKLNKRADQAEERLLDAEDERIEAVRRYESAEELWEQAKADNADLRAEVARLRRESVTNID